MDEARNVLYRVAGGTTVGDIEPSEPMHLLRKRLTDLAAFMRDQAQLDERHLLGADPTATVATDAAAAAAATTTSGAASHMDRMHHLITDVAHVQVPATLVQLKEQVRQRCLMLLAFRPSVYTPVVGTGAEDGSDATADAAATTSPTSSQLEGKWAGLLSPPSVPPLLARWRSHNTATVATDDLPAAPPLLRAVSTGGASTRQLSTMSGDGESGTIAMSIFNCFKYVTAGNTAPPNLVLAVVARRAARSVQVSHGSV